MLNRSIEEDTIWKIISELQLHEPTDPIEEEEVDGDESGGINTHISYVTKREDLARFLKKVIKNGSAYQQRFTVTKLFFIITGIRFNNVFTIRDRAKYNKICLGKAS
jgi:hypothetical protein